MTHRNRCRIVVVIASGLLWLGCGASPPPPGYHARFRVVSDDGQALAGIPIAARGLQVGTTNPSGELDVLLDGAEGEAVSIAVQCGAEFRAARPAASLRLTRTKQLAGRSPQSGIPYDVTCARRVRSVVIVAQADNLPGVPIAVEGKVVALTDADGIAHALVALDADARVLHVGFDTSNRHELLPKNPGRAFEVAPGDDLLIFEQKFTVTQKWSPPRVAAKPRHVPVRID